MNKFLKIFSVFLLGTLFFSCSSDKVELPEEASTEPNLEVEIFLDGSVFSAAVSDEEVYYESAEMKYATSLIFAIHRAEDGLFIKAETLWGDDLKKIRKNEKNKEIAVLKQGLPEGKYYVSLMCLTKGEALPAQALSLLSKPYDEAVCVIDPREGIYFNSLEVSVKKNEVTRREAQLTKMTGAYIYLFKDVDKIPDDAEVQIQVSAKGLPLAFYLKNKQTLTNEEAAELDIKRFVNAVELSEKPTSQMMTKLFLLENKDLPEKGSERGTLNIVVSVDSPGEGGAKSKIVNTICPTKRANYLVVIDEIFSTKEPEVMAN